MIRKSNGQGSFRFTNVNVTTVLTYDGIYEVSSSACKGGSDFVSLVTGSHNSLSVEDIFARLAAGSVVWRSHTWGGSLRILSTKQVVRKVLVATARGYGHVAENVLSAFMLAKDAVIDSPLCQIF